MDDFEKQLTAYLVTAEPRPTSSIELAMCVQAAHWAHARDLKEIKRLREALEFIIKESNKMGGGMTMNGYSKAKQALAGGE